jgi:tetratricopeptide (TPR) repeat protein
VTKLLGGASTSRAHSAARSAAAIPAANLGLAPTMATTPPSATPVVKASTTLSSAASASRTDVVAPKKRKTGLFAIAAVVVLGGGAAAFALVTRDTEKPAHVAHHHEATPTPVIPTPPQPGSNADPSPMLKDLAAKKDYAGILEVQNDLDKTNPDVMAIVADAKKNFIAQRTARIAEHVTRDDCAGAKESAADAASVLPDAKADFDKAATCTPKAATKPATAPPTPAPVAATPELAAAAYAKGDYKGALAGAEQVLQKTPKDASALDTAVRSACALHQTDVALKYYLQLASAARPATITTCKQAGVDLMAPVMADTETAMHTAQSALDKGDWTNARTAAKQALKLEPNNKAALHVLGVAACRLHDDATYEDVMAKTRQMPRVASGIRRACSERSGE